MDDNTPVTREETLAKLQETLPGKTVAQIDYRALSEDEGDLVITFNDRSVLFLTGDHLNWGTRDATQEQA